MVVRNIILLPQWYREQGSIDQRIWFTLTEDSFIAWNAKHSHAAHAPGTMSSPTRPTPEVPTKNTSDVESFQRSIKRSPDNYKKLKDDSRWKQWNRHLKATAKIMDIAKS
jgi:hypothetical protein